jgi:energy-coupling factor transport system substrate-specific component
MKEFLSMWKYRSMFMLFIFSTLLYLIVLLPFESGHISFDLKAFQPLAALPVVLGLFFGPAGVLGAGAGAFFVDLYSGISQMTIFMIVGNMLMALISYRLWDKLFVQTDALLVVPRRQKRIFIINLFLVVVVSAMAKALFIGLGNVILSDEVFYSKGISIFINDALGGFLLSIISILVFLNRLRIWEMIWSDLMRPGDMGVESIIGAWISLISILLFFLLSLTASLFNNNILVVIFGILGLVGIIIGLFWKGRVA